MATRDPIHDGLMDAAKRASDEYGTHRIGDPYGSIGKWIAIRLDDGSSDHVAYDSKAHAVRHQHHDEKYYAFLQIGPWPLAPKDAAVFLKINRRLYDAGMRMSDPDHDTGGPEMIRRANNEDMLAQLRSLFRGGRPKNIIHGRKLYE